MNYYIMIPKKISDSVRIDSHPEMGIKDYEFESATPLKERFPSRPEYKMSERKTGGRVLYSIIDNAMRLLIVSKAFKGIIDIHPGSNIEFLPITILNHRGKVASDDYFIANVLTKVDCINLEQSEYEPDPFVPAEFGEWDKLEIMEENIPDDLEIFILEQIRTACVIKEPIKKKIEADESITGVRFVPIEEYTSYTY